MTFYNFTNVTKTSADLHINGQIGKSYWDSDAVYAAKFVKDLDALGKGITDINLYLNSVGGEVWDGIAIYNALKEHSATVNVFIRGLAASIASVIAMAGDTIHIAKTAQMMVHDPSVNYVSGNATHLRKMANRLDKAKKSILAAYKTRDLTLPEGTTLDQLVADETWMDADEALEYGFADQITGEDADKEDIENIFASSMLHTFQKIPGQLVAMAHPAAKSKKVVKPIEVKETNMSVENAGVTEEQMQASIQSALAAQAIENRKSFDKENFINGLDRLVADGKLLPADKQTYETMADSLAGQKVKLSDGKEIPAYQNMLNGLQTLPVNGLAETNKPKTTETGGTQTPHASQVTEGTFAVDLSKCPKNVDHESFILQAWVAKEMKAKGHDAANLKTDETKQLYRDLMYRAEGEGEVVAVLVAQGLRTA